jgi:hypothetical protein
MQPNIHAHHVHAMRNAAALSAALAFCLALAFPAYCYAAGEAQVKSGAIKLARRTRWYSRSATATRKNGISP